MIGSQNTSLTELRLWDNQIGDVGASGLGAGLAYVSFVSLDERRSHATPPVFCGLIRGIIKVCVCLICSQNNTLTELSLSENQIGIAGAASIGGALAYVTL